MSLWFDPVRLPHCPHHPPPDTLSHHLGIVITAIGSDCLTATMPVDGRTRQPAGRLHGGASVALAETVMSLAAAWTVDPVRWQAFGAEINANHLRAVSDGQVTAVARPLHRGRRLQVWGCEIRDVADALVCVARMTVALQERRT